MRKPTLAASIGIVMLVVAAHVLVLNFRAEDGPSANWPWQAWAAWDLALAAAFYFLWWRFNVLRDLIASSMGPGYRFWWLRSRGRSSS